MPWNDVHAEPDLGRAIGIGGEGADGAGILSFGRELQVELRGERHANGVDRRAETQVDVREAALGEGIIRIVGIALFLP